MTFSPEAVAVIEANYYRIEKAVKRCVRIFSQKGYGVDEDSIRSDLGLVLCQAAQHYLTQKVENEDRWWNTVLSRGGTRILDSHRRRNRLRVHGMDMDRIPVEDSTAIVDLMDELGGAVAVQDAIQHGISKWKRNKWINQLLAA